MTHQHQSSLNETAVIAANISTSQDSKIFADAAAVAEIKLLKQDNVQKEARVHEGPLSFSENLVNQLSKDQPSTKAQNLKEA